MRYSWFIDHDKGIGEFETTNYYRMTEEEIKNEMQRMQKVRIVLYDYGRLNFNVYPTR